ncbi:hypothetical protein [Paraburkholderia azotifigens]|uniref:Uncharacterized protein n=1 Tax=Paraburkholderia azotifigens TaxID=2057004 RepID=A0A5C6V973_9BURK|nr:hypothetical protein [Paraburkholderia azotifigens]TXC81041.1 hypothetical protein FRZ40_43375 [Paraburkholderia azotifigens]
MVYDVVSTSFDVDRLWQTLSDRASVSRWANSFLVPQTDDIVRMQSVDESLRSGLLSARSHDALWPLLHRQGARLKRLKWYRQRYIVARGEQGIEQLALVPLSWDRSSVVAEIDDRWNYQTGNWNLRLRLTDGILQSIVGYFMQGDMHRALKLLEGRPEIFASEITNPYAAIIAGYVIVHSDAQAIPYEGWAAWIQNLATQHPGIPDTQILLATIYLQRRKLMGSLAYHNDLTDAQRLHAAWSLLDLSMNGGLPIYSMGSRLLVDNLEILSYELESWSQEVVLDTMDGRPKLAVGALASEIRKAAAAARLFGLCVQSSQLFNVLTIA